MTKVIVKNVCMVVIVAAIVGGFSSSLLNSRTMTEVGTYVALSQLNNDTTSALLLDLYNKVRHTLFTVDIGAVLGAIIAAFLDIYKFKKEHTDEEA